MAVAEPERRWRWEIRHAGDVVKGSDDRFGSAHAAIEAGKRHLLTLWTGEDRPPIARKLQGRPARGITQEEPTMTTTSGRVLAGLGIFVVLGVLVILVACAGWVGAQKYQEGVEQRARRDTARCRLVAIRYDAIHDSGYVVHHCPKADGGTEKLTSPVAREALKEEVNRL